MSTKLGKQGRQDESEVVREVSSRWCQGYLHTVPAPHPIWDSWHLPALGEGLLYTGVRKPVQRLSGGQQGSPAQ